MRITYNGEPVRVVDVCPAGECEFDMFVHYLKKQRYPGNVAAVCNGEESPSEYLGPRSQIEKSNYMVGEPIMALPVQELLPKHKEVAPTSETEYSLSPGPDHPMTPEQRQIASTKAASERRIAENLRVAEQKLENEQKLIEEAGKRLAEDQKKLDEEKLEVLKHTQSKQKRVEDELRARRVAQEERQMELDRVKKEKLEQ